MNNHEHLAIKQTLSAGSSFSVLARFRLCDSGSCRVNMPSAPLPSSSTNGSSASAALSFPLLNTLERHAGIYNEQHAYFLPKNVEGFTVFPFSTASACFATSLASIFTCCVSVRNTEQYTFEEYRTSVATRCRTAYLETLISEALLPSYVTATSMGLRRDKYFSYLREESRSRVQAVHELTVFSFLLDESNLKRNHHRDQP